MQQKGSRCGTSYAPGSAACVHGRVASAPCLLVTALPHRAPGPGCCRRQRDDRIHGQGRVTSEPAGAIDCRRAAPRVRRLDDPDATRGTRERVRDRAVILHRGGCVHGDAERLRLHDRRLLPAAGEAPAVAERRRDDHRHAAACGLARRADRGVLHPRELLRGHRLRLLLPAGSPVNAMATPGSATRSSASARRTARQRLLHRRSRPRHVSVARFSPLEVRVIRRGNDTGSIVSEPPGIACPPTCTAPFRASSQVTLDHLTRPGIALPRLEVRCTVSTTDRAAARSL